MSQPLSAANSTADPALVSVLTRALQDKQREVDELQERLRAVEGYARDEPMPEAAMEGVEAPLPVPEELRSRSPTQSASESGRSSPTLSDASARSYDLPPFADHWHHNYFGLYYPDRRFCDYAGLPPLVMSVRPPPYAYYEFQLYKDDYPELVPELKAESVSEGSVEGDAADE
ncbi:hypothetical protein MIND_00191100 [Mycena indigotica]|uniref:Uncharacterized protein n=1 Tax=Mycena indigotica TaxID=2126181 RepID=A0A8H6WCV0_9AGAR|nr:uncharacterized protein MIND_00191100 [Mycena indigotica]KAF7311806.1 hypothetical protein MIND_00191100 [Mycena indigotica]